jgi:hypothetical protein
LFVSFLVVFSIMEKDNQFCALHRFLLKSQTFFYIVIEITKQIARKLNLVQYGKENKNVKHNFFVKSTPVDDFLFTLYKKIRFVFLEVQCGMVLYPHKKHLIFTQKLLIHRFVHIIHIRLKGEIIRFYGN